MKLHFLIIPLVILLFGNFQVAMAQCDGPFQNGDSILFASSGISIAPSITDQDFIIERVGDVIQIRSISGMKFLEGFPGEVKNVNMSDNLTAMTPYLNGPLALFNLNTNTGPFGGGNSGFIGVEKDGRYGWIELEECGAKFCSANTYETRIRNRCLSAEPGGAVMAGNVNSLNQPVPIPTLSEWSLIVLALLFMIISVVAFGEFRDLENIKETNHGF